MKPERLVEILGKVLKIPAKTMESYIENDSHDLTVTLHEALTAMTRAVDEETARLRECEAIVRELAEDSNDSIYNGVNKSRQWVRENPESETTLPQLPVSGLACKCGNQTFTHRHSNWIECTACNKIQALQA